MLEDIKNYSNWKNVEKISKGWSSDIKYSVTTNDNQKLLLRVSDIKCYDEKKEEYSIIKKFSESGIEMNQPVDFGLCNNGKKVYILLTWIEGDDLEKILPTLSFEEQYELGLKAGKILRKIHSIKFDEKDFPINNKKEKLLIKLDKYINSIVRIQNDDKIINYIKNNIDCIWSVNPTFCHGDFHPGNLIYMPDKEIGVIDFNRWAVTDPYEEFYKLSSFGVEASIPYCVGQIESYFNGDIPNGFWKAQKVYVAWSALYSIAWASKFGDEEISKMTNRAIRMINDYDDMTLDIPKWFSSYNKTK